MDLLPLAQEVLRDVGPRRHTPQGARARERPPQEDPRRARPRDRGHEGDRLKKMVSAEARREAVGYARSRGLSQRRACRLLAVARSALFYRSRLARRDRKMRRRLRVIARRWPRWGYRRAWALLRAKGHAVTPKRVHHLWRAAGLSLPQRRS